MMKKLLSLVGCLVPFGAGAVTVSPANPSNPNFWTPGADAVIGSADGSVTGVTTAPGDDNVAMTAAGLNISGGAASGGLDVAGDLYIGAVPGTLGSMYATNDVATFDIQSDGAVAVDGNVLVANGKSLSIYNSRGFTPNVTLGQVTANGAFSAANVGAFTVAGAVTTADDLEINAASIDIDGAVDVSGGDAKITSANLVEIGGLVNTGGGTVDITGRGLHVTGAGAVVQNASGVMNVTGGLDVMGNLENSGPADMMADGAKMTVTGGDVTVQGTVKNDSNKGDMTFVNISNFAVNGVGTDLISLVNKGDFTLDASGDVVLDGVIDLSSMGADNKFSLTAGTLYIGNRDFAFANGTNDITVNSGGISVNNIINGANNNSGVVTDIKAQNLSAANVTNRGVLNIETDTSVAIRNGLNVVTGANTKIVTDGAVNIGTGASGVVPGAWGVANDGVTEINGETVSVAGVANTGAIRITAPTSETGGINITGDVTNLVANSVSQTSDDMFINGRKINIAGTLNNQQGVTTIQGADSVTDNALQVGAINVAGGVVNMNALNGGITVSDFATDVTLDNRPAGTIVVGQNGAMNVGNATYNITAQNGIDFAGTVTLGGANDATGNGNVNIKPSTSTPVVLTVNNGKIHVGRDVMVMNTAGTGRALKFAANEMEIDGNVNVIGTNSSVTFGNSGDQDLKIGGDVNVGGNATIEIFDDDNVDVGALYTSGGNFIFHGTGITAKTGTIIVDDILIGDSGTGGFVVRGDELTLATTSNGSDIMTGAVTLDSGEALNLDSAGGVTVEGAVNNNGALVVQAPNGNISLSGDVKNSGNVTISGNSVVMHNYASQGAGGVAKITSDTILRMGDVQNYGTLTLAAQTLTAGVLDLRSQVEIDATKSVTVDRLLVYDGQTNIETPALTVDNDITVYGNMTQAGAGMLNLNGATTVASADKLYVDGDYIAADNTAKYNVAETAIITGDVTVASGAATTIDAGGVISANDVTVNGGDLTLISDAGIKLNTPTNNNGYLYLDSGAGVTEIAEYTANTGVTYLAGVGLDSLGAVKASGNIYQNTSDTVGVGDIYVSSPDYTINASNVIAAGIKQANGKMSINTSDIDVAGDIYASDLRIAVTTSTNWLNVNVDGDVSGGVKFIGLEKMTIGGNYTFNDASQINAAILPYAAGGVMNSSDVNYWSTISLNNDNTLGRITNAADGGALITVGGAFKSELNNLGTPANGNALADAQVGIVLRDVVDQGTAIWLLHADDGLFDDAFAKMRDVNVSFCNADGSICYNYMDSLNANNATDEQLPVYLSQRDSDGDGNADSLYVVFDPRFGGPVNVFQIQPIVGRTDNHTAGEFMSAGALDNLVAGQLQEKLFFNNAPIETIPLIFAGTNMQELGNELYDRMEYYYMNRDGDALTQFSRLFQPREIEQVAASISLNEHTNFRSFEDRMFDEFIWNRNRNLRKAWADVEFGMFVQDATDNKRIDGNRFNVSGGFDWQESETLVVGLTGRLSHMSADNSDSMNLGYRPDAPFIAGHVKTDVSDTNLGMGAYLMKILGNKTRLYGNGFLDLHFLDVDREQNYVDRIDGDGLAVALTSEWGLMHDWLNQYVVGNLYTRVGYNFGFSVKETAAGHDYMRLESDGYMILTPGYSLTAQKRIYPSAWFQMRPYATIGVEYDVLGAPDSVEYKFAPAKSYTDYDINIDPLWANIGGGIEFLSATGVQVGLDYRYQYNNDIQLHNIKLSGSYRF